MPGGVNVRFGELVQRLQPVDPVRRINQEDAIVDGLDKAFYLSFGNVRSTGKRIVLALDVSGSMTSGAVAGVPGLTPRVASAAMALITAATEPNHQVVAFSNQMVPVNISPRQRLDDVLKNTDNIPFGGTDCALPMI